MTVLGENLEAEGRLYCWGEQGGDHLMSVYAMFPHFFLYLAQGWHKPNVGAMFLPILGVKVQHPFAQ